MWFIQPKEDYVSRMPWKHADEPAVMSWKIRARDYNTFVANIVFSIMALFATGMGYFISTIDDEPHVRLIMGGIIFLITILVGMSMTHQTTIIVYRFTEKGAEVCAWKPQIDSVKPVMKWTAIVSGVAVLFLIFVDPAFLIAAIGPVGLGLMAATMGSSKGYQSWARDDRHYETNWRKAHKIRVFRRRRIIGLDIQWHNAKVGKDVTSTKAIFCHKKELDERLEFFRRRLPDVPLVEEKFKVFH